ncbi:MAG: hypothetical protein ABEJ89_05120 [Haloarculaceae archaeon]
MKALDLLGLVWPVAVATPAAVYGADLLARGHLTGLGLLGLAALAVIVPQVITTPGDLPGAGLQAVLGAVAADGWNDGEGTEREDDGE